MKYLATLICFFMVTGCEPEKDPDIIPEEKMEKIMWELIEADEWALYQYPMDTTARKQAVIRYYQKVFEINQVSRDVFKKSYTYYSNRPTLLGPVLDSMRNRALSPSPEQAPTPRPKKPFKPV